MNWLRKRAGSTALLGIVALAVRVAGALVRRPWHDEYFTDWVARLPWSELLAALRLDSGPPLPYALTKIFVLLGVSPIGAARGISVAAGTLAVLLGARAAERAFGTAAGRWCGWLLALHPLAIAWSCEGRAYTLLFLATAWGWERLEVLADEGRGASGLAGAVTLACWSHGLGVILGASAALAAFTLNPARRRNALLAIAAGMATLVPWIPVALRQPPAATAWMVQAWHALPVWQRVLSPVRLVSPLADFGATVDLPSAPLSLSIAVLAACAFLAIQRRPPLRPFGLFAFGAVGLTALAAFDVPAYYPGRAEALFLLPALAIVAAGAASGKGPTAVGLTLITGAVAVTGFALVDWRSTPPRPEERLATAVRAAMPHGGTILVGGYWRLGVEYHLRDPAFALVNVPSAAASHPGWYDDRSDRLSPAEVGALRERLLGERRSGRDLAVIVAPGAATARTLAELARTVGLAPITNVPGGVLHAPPPVRPDARDHISARFPAGSHLAPEAQAAGIRS